MEVSPGYKKTDVGVIPEDWAVAELKDLCREPITYGIVQCGPHIDNGVPYIRVSDMSSPDLDVSGMLRTSPNIAAQFSRSMVREGDVVYALRGKIGEVRHVNSTVAGANLTQGTARLSPSGRVDAIYLLWTLRSQRALRQGDLAAKGSTFREITLEALRKIQLPVSSLPEQRAIAAALSDVDALLGKLDVLIAKKRGLKQAAMQQLLTGQTRLPGFSGAWEVRPLASVIENLEAGVSVNSVERGKPLGSGEACILKTSAILDGRFDPEECKLIDRRDVHRARLRPKRDTIIISRMNTPNLVGEVGFVPRDFPTLFLPDRLWMTRFDFGADLCARWLAYVLSSARVKEKIKELATGTSGTMKNISKGALLALQLEFPSGAEQTAIATVLSDMDAELAALEARRDKTRALKQGMMQELLTGRIRLV